MNVDKELRDHIFSIVDHQIKSNTPPETNLTFKRLSLLGYTAFQIKQMIGQCISVELFEIANSGKPFDAHRYTENLKKLPKEPFD